MYRCSVLSYISCGEIRALLYSAGPCVCVCVCKHEDIFLHSQSLPVTSGSQLYPSDTHWNIYTACVVTSMTYVVGGVFEIKPQWIWAQKHSKWWAGECVNVNLWLCVCVWGGVLWDCVQENKYETHPGPRWRMCIRDCGSFTAQCSICEVGLWIMAKKI